MLIITNRNINKSKFENGIGNHEAFGDKMNPKGPNEVRLARAEKVDDEWKITLIDEPSKITPDNIPSKKEFKAIRDKLTAKKKNCVFFIHGFNQSFYKNLEKARKIQERYNVEVIAFSWPSNPGGFKTKEYRQAKRNALASVGALDATLEKLGQYLKEPFNKDLLKACETKFSLLVYSLGNYLVKNYIENAIYEDETRVFSNVVLCQPDVDNRHHAAWVDKLEVSKRTYITINEDDWVLKWSDANFQRDRLGSTARHLNSNSAIYMDFTDGHNVGRTHGVFYKDTNTPIQGFFDRALNGKRGEKVKGFYFDKRLNAFKCK